MAGLHRANLTVLTASPQRRTLAVDVLAGGPRGVCGPEMGPVSSEHGDPLASGVVDVFSDEVLHSLARVIATYAEAPLVWSPRTAWAVSTVSPWAPYAVMVVGLDVGSRGRCRSAVDLHAAVHLRSTARLQPSTTVKPQVRVRPAAFS